MLDRIPLDTDLLRSFVMIANHGNLTVAARHLGRTQSAVSVQLRRLEDQLGSPLFDRQARGMTLNEAGQKLLPRATAILAQLREVGAMFADPLSGSIRIGFPDDYDDRFLEHVLTAFSQTHPAVNVVATSGCTATFPEAVKRGDLDIAVYSSVGNSEGTYLCDEPVVWAKKTGAQIDPDQPLPLAILDRHCWWRDLPTKALETEGRDYTITFRSSSFLSLQSAIRAGFAVSILPAATLAKNPGVFARIDWLPSLPTATRTIITSTDAQTTLVSAMTEAIQDALLEVGP